MSAPADLPIEMCPAWFPPEGWDRIKDLGKIYPYNKASVQNLSHPLNLQKSLGACANHYYTLATHDDPHGHRDQRLNTHRRSSVQRPEIKKSSGMLNFPHPRARIGSSCTLWDRILMHVHGAVLSGAGRGGSPESCPSHSSTPHFRPTPCGPCLTPRCAPLVLPH